jgi:hypothetical protein
MVGTKGGVGTEERNGGQTESMGDAVGTLADAVAQDFAARFLVVGGEAEPRREVIGGGELGDIGADFGEDNLNRGGGETVDFEEIDTGQTAEMRLNGLGRGVLGVSVVALLVRSRCG